MTQLFEGKLADWNIEGDYSPITLVALFVFLGLIVGVVMRTLNKRTKIPYTPTLLVIGIIVSFCGKHIGLISKSTDLIAQIDPSGLLLIFIPIIILESSFNADWHAFRKSLKQVLLLAGPGVVVAFSIIALILKGILGYSDEELSWSSALMIGAILGATDPVAIVALFKELRAPIYFSTVVEGESLLNDGTGVVFFTIFSNLAAGNTVGAGLGISSFLVLCLGGVALGLVFSLITSSWLEKIFDDSILSISITISSCYLLYWVSGTFTAHFTGGMEVGVSGILALCTLGLYLSAYGKINISNKIELPLHTVIQWTQYVSETLIFLLAGILAGKIFIAEGKTLLASDWWKLILFFVLINLSRGLMVALFSPMLNKIGPKLNFKELFVLSYAGLRGALGIALALTVNANTEKFSARTRELVLFYVTGTAALSLLINGTTTGYLVRKIKMLPVFPAKQKIFRAFKKEVAAFTEERYERLQDQNSTTVCDWEVVKKITACGAKYRREEDLAPQAQSQSQSDIRESALSCALKVEEEDLKAEARCRMLRIAKGLIWERFEYGQLEAYGANILNKAINDSLDSLNKGIHVFEFLKMYYTKRRWLEFYAKLGKIPFVGRYFKNLVVDNMVFIYDVTSSLVEVIEGLKNHADNVPIQADIMNEVMEELEENKRKAQEHLRRVEDRFLSIAKYINTKRQIVHILLSQRQFIADRYVHGIIEAKEYDELSHDIDEKLQNLNKLVKVKWEPPTFENIVATCPLLSALPGGDLDMILETSEKVTIRAGGAIFTEGERFDGIYLITRGDVEIRYNGRTFTRGIGHFVSFINLALNDCVSRITCTALHDIEVQKLNVSVLREIMKRNAEFESKIYKEAFLYLRFMNPGKAGELTKLSDSSIQILLKNSEIQRFAKGENICLNYEAFIIKGSLKRKEKIYEQYQMIPKSEESLLAESDGVLIKFCHQEDGQESFIQKEKSSLVIDKSSLIKQLLAS